MAASAVPFAFQQLCQPDAGTLVVSAQTDGSNTVLWTFDRDVTWDETPETSLEINTELEGWAGMIDGTQTGARTIEALYSVVAAPTGRPWRIASPITHIAATPAILVPQSGTLTAL